MEAVTLCSNFHYTGTKKSIAVSMVLIMDLLREDDSVVKALLPPTLSTKGQAL